MATNTHGITIASGVKIECKHQLRFARELILLEIFLIVLGIHIRNRARVQMFSQANQLVQKLRPKLSFNSWNRILSMLSLQVSYATSFYIKIGFTLFLVTTNGESVEYPFNYDAAKVNNFNDVDTLGRKMAREMSTIDNIDFTYRQGSSDDVIFGTIEDYLVDNLEVLYVYKIKMRGDTHLIPSGDIEVAVQEVIGALDVLQAYLIKPYYPNFRNIFDYINWDDGAYSWMVYDKKDRDQISFVTGQK